MSADIPRRLLSWSLALALAACAPAQVVITAGPGDLLPAEAVRVLDRATASAAAVATQGARATAGEIAARATSTTAAQLTRDSLAGLQTHVALQLTAGAGAAMATDAAAEKTQAAGETRQAVQAAALSTQAVQTPTAAAWRTQAALQATQAAATLARADSAAEFWAWVRWTSVAALVALALVVCALVLARGLVIIRADDRRAAAAIARDAFRVLAPGHWAEWLPGDGYRVYQLPGALDDAPVVIENAPTAPSHVHAWRQAVRLFAWWGDRYGFGIRELGAEGAGVVSDPAWRVLVRLLKGAGVLADVTLPGKRGRGTAWAPGWDYRRLADELSSGKLALPFPAGDAPPAVAFTVPTQHHDSTQHERATQVTE